MKGGQGNSKLTWGFNQLHLIEKGAGLFKIYEVPSLSTSLFPVAVYMSQHKHLWEHNKMFETSLSCGTSSDEAGTQSPPKNGTYGPGKMGCTYELCAGIVDKKMSLQQIAQEEVLEETGKSRFLKLRLAYSDMQNFMW